MTKVIEMSVADLTLDPDVRGRADYLNEAAVRFYTGLIKDALERGEPNPFPAIKGVKTPEGKTFVPDGGLRLKAAMAAGLNSIMVDLIEGTKRDAVLLAITSNTDHGLQRSEGDKGFCTRLLLQDIEWKKWTNTHIAKLIKVSETYVRKIRKESEKDGYIPLAIVQYQDSKGNIKFMVNKAVARIAQAEAETARLNSLILNRDHLEAVLKFGIEHLKNQRDTTMRAYIQTIKGQLDKIMAGLDPFKVEESKEDKKEMEVKESVSA